MIGVIVVSENKTSEEMLKTLNQVLGKKNVKGFSAISLTSRTSVHNFEKNVYKIQKQLQVEKLILFIEVYGSTQCQYCDVFKENPNIRTICGYNLPMLMKAATMNQANSLSFMVKKIKSIGKKYIRELSND